MWSTVICADINRLRNSETYTYTNSNSNKLKNAAKPTFCNRFWIENAWEIPKQTVRISELYTGVLSYCSRAAGSVVMTLSAQHLPELPQSTMLPVTILDG